MVRPSSPNPLSVLLKLVTVDKYAHIVDEGGGSSNLKIICTELAAK